MAPLAKFIPSLDQHRRRRSKILPHHAQNESRPPCSLLLGDNALISTPPPCCAGLAPAITLPGEAASNKMPMMTVTNENLFICALLSIASHPVHSTAVSLLTTRNIQYRCARNSPNNLCERKA